MITSVALYLKQICVQNEIRDGRIIYLYNSEISPLLCVAENYYKG